MPSLPAPPGGPGRPYSPYNTGKNSIVMIHGQLEIKDNSHNGTKMIDKKIQEPSNIINVCQEIKLIA